MRARPVVPSATPSDTLRHPTGKVGDAHFKVGVADAVLMTTDEESEDVDVGAVTNSALDPKLVEDKDPVTGSEIGVDEEESDVAIVVPDVAEDDDVMVLELLDAADEGTIDDDAAIVVEETGIVEAVFTLETAEETATEDVEAVLTLEPAEEAATEDEETAKDDVDTVLVTRLVDAVPTLDTAIDFPQKTSARNDHRAMQGLTEELVDPEVDVDTAVEVAG